MRREVIVAATDTYEVCAIYSGWSGEPVGYLGYLINPTAPSYTWWQPNPPQPPTEEELTQAYLSHAFYKIGENTARVVEGLRKALSSAQWEPLGPSKEADEGSK